MSVEKKIVVLTGAGVSAESGIKTFRDSGGLWEEYRIEEVASYNAWVNNPKLVLEFYNIRRKQLESVTPNAAHYALAKLEEKYDVHVITQNIDDLHERGGSSKILHLHGELTKARSTADDNLIYDIRTRDILWGDLCEKESQLRPHIVWFGEAVPEISNAAMITETADILLVIGTSLNVYPAAGLINYTRQNIQKYIIDPNADKMGLVHGWNIVAKTAAVGVPEVVEKLMNV